MWLKRKCQTPGLIGRSRKKSEKGNGNSLDRTAISSIIIVLQFKNCDYTVVKDSYIHGLVLVSTGILNVGQPSVVRDHDKTRN